MSTYGAPMPILQVRTCLKDRKDVSVSRSATPLSLSFMITFMYSFNYNEEAYTTGSTLVHAKVHEVADSYDMSHLKAVAAIKFRSAVEISSQSLSMISSNTIRIMKLKDFFAALALIYVSSNLDVKVKDAVLFTVFDHQNGTADVTPSTDGSGNVSPSPMVSGDAGNSTSNILDNSGNSTANANKRRHMVVRLRV
ncbi:hypothetical protein BLS_006598 [Venturia inaequalis]|uniref:Uncharacterized protein n=1 Tax=Venturia inaequalis TaxID=5025 RepID=A0A8H3VV54_VENIN|nr:hypothetical protein EG328_003274 [Venturia inaequalis]KAE9982061.1 hypothetical protein BLS_006598 [Venturia inaequalis]KAE9994378.1 hypothetical protein EG327_010818 [Venturia inaequalis]